MKTKLCSVIAMSLISCSSLWPVSASAESQVIESEEHYVRALRDRTNLLKELNDLALERSKTAAIVTFANRTSAEFPQRMTQIVTIAEQLEISGVGGMGGAPAGAGNGMLSTGNRPAAGAQMAGSGPQPQAGNRGGGPSARNKAVMESVSQFEGDEFDLAYVLTVLRVHEEIERHVLGEIMLPAGNPVLAEWSKNFVIPYARDSESAQQILSQSGDGNPVQAADANDPNRKGPTLEQMNPGALFGLSIKQK